MARNNGTVPPAKCALLYSWLIALCFLSFTAVSEAATDPGLVGDWINDNASSSGVTRINIRLGADGIPIVRILEGYHQENDWGDQSATVQEPAGKELLVTCNVRGIYKNQKLSLMPDGSMRLSDKSGRPSYYVAGTFIKASASNGKSAAAKNPAPTPAGPASNENTKTGAHPVTVTRDYKLGGPQAYIQLTKGQVVQGKVFIDRLEIQVRGVWYTVPRNVAR